MAIRLTSTLALSFALVWSGRGASALAPGPAAAAPAAVPAAETKAASAVPAKPLESISQRAFDAAEPGFRDLDCLDHNGVITVNEAATFGTKNGIAWYKMKPIFDAIDADKNGEITREEYKLKQMPMSQDMLETLSPGFADLDLNGDGALELPEWKGFCEGWMDPKPSAALCDALFQGADTSDPRGQLSREEFDKGGSNCKTLDDGNCAFLQTAASSSGRIGARLGRSKERSLATWSTSHLRPQTAAQALGELIGRARKVH